MQFWLWNKQAAEQVDECDFTAAALTALFDGEATPEEAAQARTHLITCARCAELWAGWNQTRYLFQQAPVMAPPRLLLRILMACRLASSKEATEKTTPVADAHQSVGRRNTEDLTFSTGLREPAPPSSLHEEILRRTTRAASPAPVPTRTTVAPVPRLRFGGFSFNTRYAAATAVPAMLVLMTFVASNSYNSAYTPLQGESIHASVDGGTIASLGKSAAKTRRHLASAMHQVAQMQPAFAINNARAPKVDPEVIRGDDIVLSESSRERAGEIRRVTLRETATANEFQPQRREAEPSSRLNEAASSSKARPVPVPANPAKPQVASPGSNAAAIAGGVQFASLSLPQSTRFEREVAALPPVATMSRIAPAALMLVRRMASARPAVGSNASTRGSNLRTRSRAALTPMPMPVTTQLASFRGGSASLSSTRHVDAETSSDNSDGWSGDRDFRDNRPEAVKSVIENFRAALDQDDSDSIASDG